MQINIDNGMLISTFIGAVATLAGAFGGTYWAAKLNNASKQKDILQNNINKTLFLHSFIEKYLNQLLDYKENIIDPKVKDLSASNLVKVYKRYPYVSYKIDIKMEDYNYFINENKDLWNLLYQVLHFSESFDSTVKIHDSLAHGFQPPVDMVFITRLQDTVKTLAVTCDNLVFFLLLLYKNLHILLEKVYKQEFTCADNLMIMSNFDLSKLDEHEKGWVEGLKNSWK